jgi:hypothetical protein
MWQVKRQIDCKTVVGGYFPEWNLEGAKRKADELVYEYIMRTGPTTKYKMNFCAPRGAELAENTNIAHGVYWNNLIKKWRVQRKFGKKQAYGGCFLNLEAAKCRADEMVIKHKLEIGKETNHKLNFSRNDLPKISKKVSEPMQDKARGVYRCNVTGNWYVRRTLGGKIMSGGTFSDFEEAKHISDDLVYKYEKKIGCTGTSNKKLNFPRKQKNVELETNGESAWKRKRDENQSKDL